MRTRSLITFLLLTAFIAGISPIVHAATVTITTIYSGADTYVDSGNPNTNYGGIVTMWIRGNSPTRRGLLQFNLSSIPVNAQISSAVLKLYVSSDGSPVAGSVSNVNGSWVEKTVTYATAPQLGSLIASLPNPATPNSSVSVDLTSTIIGKSIVNFYITSSSNDGVVYYTHEKGTAQSPRLIISWTTGSTSTPITTGTTTSTSTQTPTLTSSSTATITNTATPTRTSTATGTATLVNTPTPSSTPLNTATPTKTATNTSTTTVTFTSTATIFTTPTSTMTATPTVTSVPSSMTLIPVADSYVDTSKPTTNYGTLTTLRVDGSPSVNSYLRFSVPNLGGNSISQVRLLIYANSASSSDITAKTVADNTWGETTINASNAPAMGSTLATSPAVVTGTWITYNVISYVTGPGTFSFGLSTAGGTAISLASHESGAHSPQLIITTNQSIPTATATPTSTSTSTPTDTPSSTATPTGTQTNIPTPTVTPTPSSTQTPSPTSTSTPDGSLALPLRLAFYYPWFPEAWTQGGVYPFTNYTPTLGFYDSSNLSIINQHIADMQYAGIQGGIASWWGPGTPTDGRIRTLLNAAAGSNFKWTLYYEPEGIGNPTVAVITSDLTYIFNNYAQNQNYLHIGGKPVLFVYADATDNCNMADRWRAGNTLGFYVVLKVFSGYPICANQPDSWHQYGPGSNYDQQGSYSVTISPGFWLKGNPVLLARDLTRWNQDISNMVAANPNFQLITTWNEWGEGTSVESSVEFGRSYLDALHNNGQVTPTPTPTQSPTPIAIATDPVVVAAGDIVCDSLTTTSSNCLQMTASQAAVDQNPTAALILGDLCHTPSANCFTNFYNPSWGRLFSISYPITGNHEYLVPEALYYFDYWNGPGNTTGPAGDRSQGYYSFDLGTWHLIALNSQCSEVGGCNSGSPQYTWLQQDLLNHTNKCTLAYYHIPVFSSGGRANNNMLQIYTLLYNNNVEVVLDGHDHIYERFAPQDPNGLADPLRGIREFIVGTGGANHTSIASIQPNSEVRNTDTFGALKLTLHPNSYDWQFVPEAGKTFTDSGTTLCH